MHVSFKNFIRLGYISFKIRNNFFNFFELKNKSSKK